MPRPIATPPHAPSRTRRRQGSPSPLRAALIVAVLLTCVFSLPTIVGAARSVLPARAGLIGESGPGQVAEQVALGGVEQGACVSFGRSQKTVFIDPGHGGLDPGVVGMNGGHQVLETDVALAGCPRPAARLRDPAPSVRTAPRIRHPAAILCTHKALPR